MKKKVTKLKDFMSDEGKYILLFLLIFVFFYYFISAGIYFQDLEDNRHQQMEESGVFEGTYCIEDKAVEYHGGDHSDYLFILKEFGLWCSHKRYVVSVKQTDYYQYEINEQISCSFVWDADAEIYTDLEIHEN